MYADLTPCLIKAEKLFPVDIRLPVYVLQIIEFLNHACSYFTASDLTSMFTLFKCPTSLVQILLNFDVRK